MSDFSYVFWTGDLNFRIVDLDKAEIERRIRDKDFKSMWEYDQVTLILHICHNTGKI